MATLRDFLTELPGAIHRVAPKQREGATYAAIVEAAIANIIRKKPGEYGKLEDAMRRHYGLNKVDDRPDTDPDQAQRDFADPGETTATLALPGDPTAAGMLRDHNYGEKSGSDDLTVRKDGSVLGAKTANSMQSGAAFAKAYYDKHGLDAHMQLDLGKTYSGTVKIKEARGILLVAATMGAPLPTIEKQSQRDALGIDTPHEISAYRIARIAESVRITDAAKADPTTRVIHTMHALATEDPTLLSEFARALPPEACLRLIELDAPGIDTHMNRIDGVTAGGAPRPSCTAVQKEISDMRNALAKGTGYKSQAKLGDPSSPTPFKLDSKRADLAQTRVIGRIFNFHPNRWWNNNTELTGPRHQAVATLNYMVSASNIARLRGLPVAERQARVCKMIEFARSSTGHTAERPVERLDDLLRERLIGPAFRNDAPALSNLSPDDFRDPENTVHAAGAAALPLGMAAGGAAGAEVEPLGMAAGGAAGAVPPLGMAAGGAADARPVVVGGGAAAAVIPGLGGRHDD